MGSGGRGVELEDESKKEREILFGDRPLRRYLAIQLSEKNYC